MAEALGRLQVEYFDGTNWIAFTSSGNSLVLELEITDTLYNPQVARFKVADLKDNGIFAASSTNSVLKEFMNIRILDVAKHIIYFSGKIFRLSKKYEVPYGEAIEVTCYDALYSLGNEFLDTDADSIAASKAHTLISTWIGNHISTSLLSVTNDSGDVDRFEVSAYNRANTSKVVKAGRSQISVLSAILQEALQDQRLTALDRGYVYYVDPNFTSTATTHNPAGFFTYFSRNRMPANGDGTSGDAAPSSNGLTIERPSGAAISETGQKHLMQSSLDVSSSSREMVTDIIAAYYNEDTGKRVSKRFSIIHYTAISGMAAAQYAGIGFDVAPGTGGSAISNLVDSGNNVIGRIQYMSTTFSADSIPGFMILSDRTSHALVAGETLSADAHGSGASLTLSSVATIGSQFVYEPKAVWGVSKTTKSNFNKESDADEIRTKLAGIFEGRQNVPDRLAFNTSQLPYYWAEGRATSSTSGAALHDSAVNWETKGVRTGASFLKLSGTGGTVAAYGYVSSLTDAGVITCTLNTGTWAVNDYYRWQVRVRAGHQVHVKCAPKGIAGENQLVTSVKIQQNMGSQTLISWETQGTAARSIPTALAETTSSTASHSAVDVGSSPPVSIGDVTGKLTSVFSAGAKSSPDGTRHNTVTWTAGTLKLNKSLTIDGNEADSYSIAQNDTTTANGGALTAGGTQYVLYFEPDESETELDIMTSASWVSADRTKLKIATITTSSDSGGSGAGVEAECMWDSASSSIIIEGSASTAEGQSSKWGADYFAVDGIQAKHMLNIGSDATSGVRFKFNTPSSGGANSWFRGFTAASVSDTTGKWFEFDVANQALNLYNGIEASVIAAQYTGKLLTFYNGSGKHASTTANNMISLGMGGNGSDGKNGLTLWGKGTGPSTSTPSLQFRKTNADDTTTAASWMYLYDAGDDFMHWYANAHAIVIESTTDVQLKSQSEVELLAYGEDKLIKLSTWNTTSGVTMKQHEADNATNDPVFCGIFPTTAMNGSDSTQATRQAAPWVNLGYMPDDDSGYNSRPFNAISAYYHYAGTASYTGTYSAPNYSWHADVDTGMYLKEDGQIGFTAANGLRASISSGGVSIHTISDQNNTAVHIHSSGLLTKATSSRRYKDNIQDLDINTDKIYDLRPVSFDWKSNGKSDFGLIAEEVSDILPELVVYNEDLTPESVQYTSLSVLLLAELKTLREEVKDLKEKL